LMYPLGGLVCTSIGKNAIPEEGPFWNFFVRS
jgi:hypothetical protein